MSLFAQRRFFPPRGRFGFRLSAFDLRLSTAWLGRWAFRLRPPVSGLPLLASVCCALLLLPGCFHYQLGTAGKLTFATVYVAPVENHALLPQAQALVGTEIREALLKDGRVALASSPESADAILRVSLAGYDREVAASQAADTGLAREFALNLRARCTLTDNRTGRVLFENREIKATQPAFTDSGQQQAEYQALSLLAQDLGAEIAHAVLDVW